MESPSRIELDCTPFAAAVRHQMVRAQSCAALSGLASAGREYSDELITLRSRAGDASRTRTILLGKQAPLPSGLLHLSKQRDSNPHGTAWKAG